MLLREDAERGCGEQVRTHYYMKMVPVEDAGRMCSWKLLIEVVDRRELMQDEEKAAH